MGARDMKYITHLLSRYGRTLLFGAWFYALIGLLPGQGYQTFLRPEFGGLLAVGLLVLIGFLFAEMGQLDRELHFGLNETIHLLILMIPLAYLPIARGTSLGSNAFQRRWTGLSADPGEKTLMSTNTSLDISMLNTERVREVTLADLCRMPRAYKDRRLAVVGMIHRAPDIKKRFGDNACVLFRFVITCCAADAMPAAILLIGEVPADWPNDTWIRAEGQFALRDDQGKPMPTLEVSKATRTAKPRRPYLY